MHVIIRHHTHYSMPPVLLHSITLMFSIGIPLSSPQMSHCFPLWSNLVLLSVKVKLSVLQHQGGEMKFLGFI